MTHLQRYILPLFIALLMACPVELFAGGAEPDVSGGGPVERVEKHDATEQGSPEDWLKTDSGAIEIPWQRLIYGVGIVLVLICGGVYILKAIGAGRFAGGQYLDVLEVVPVGNKFRLVLVRIGERAVLLACKGENVEKVGEFAADSIPAPESPDAEGDRGFAAVLGEVLGRNQ